ncbi:MAG: hypothetical protein ACRBCS_08920 [Cellvibrionaceae bacterium]
MKSIRSFILYLTTLPLFILSMSHSMGVIAQTEDKALERAQYMLKQINSEKMQLQKQLTELQKEFDEYKKNKNQEISQLNKRQQKISGSLQNWQEGYKNLKGATDQKNQELFHERRRSALLEKRFIDQTDNFEVCKNNNKDLAKINYDILGLYQDKSLFDIVKQKEKIFGFNNVKIENIVQDERYKIMDLEIKDGDYRLKEIASPSSDSDLLNKLLPWKAPKNDLVEEEISY